MPSSVKHLRCSAIQEVPGLRNKHQTRLERLARSEHSRLLRTFVNFDHKNFYNLQGQDCKITFRCRNKFRFVISWSVCTNPFTQSGTCQTMVDVTDNNGFSKLMRLLYVSHIHASLILSNKALCYASGLSGQAPSLVHKCQTRVRVAENTVVYYTTAQLLTV